MLRGKKIRLLPTPEQEILFWKSAGTSRWAYNYFLARNEEQYKTYLANGRKGKITKPYSGMRKNRSAGLSGNGQSENAGILNGSGKG